MKIHHYHPETLEYLGEGAAEADPLEPGRWLIPAHATTDAPPPEQAGKTRHFVAAAWEYRDIPPPPPEPPAPTAAQIRAGEIRARLAQIDQDSIRPARAVAAALAAGQPAPAFDAGKLANLETEAAALRAELATLTP